MEKIVSAYMEALGDENLSENAWGKLAKLNSSLLAGQIVDSKPKRKQACGICGFYLVEIRGKYPNSPHRSVCPTCTFERLEQIHEMSNESYDKNCLDKLSTLK